MTVDQLKKIIAGRTCRQSDVQDLAKIVLMAVEYYQHPLDGRLWLRLSEAMGKVGLVE